MGNILFSQFSYERFVLIVLVSSLLAVLIRRSWKKLASRFLSGYFLFVILFNIGHLITYSLMVPQGAYGWYMAALAPFGLAFLVQFAYRFPRQLFEKEARIVFAVSLGFSIIALVDYVCAALKMPVLLSETGFGSQYESPWIAPLAAALFLWAFLVFIRQSLQSEGITSKNPVRVLQRLWKPQNPGAQKARNLGLIVFFEFINTATIALYMSVRFIPYSTLLAVNNVLFLGIYVLYVVIVLTDEVEPLSFRFKMTGITFIVVLAIVGIIGSLTLYQFEDIYDATNRAELRYVRSIIAERKFDELPAHVVFIVAGNSQGRLETLYRNDERIVVPNSVALREFVPGRIALATQTHNFTKMEQFEEGRRYFSQLGGMNYHVYVLKGTGMQYGVGYSFMHYREVLHEKVLRMILILVASLAIVVLIVPVLVKAGLLRPLDVLLGNIAQSSHVPDASNEISKVSHSLQEIIETRKALEEENLRLKEETKRKKRPDYAITEPGKHKIEQALTYIHENYRFDISREGLAASVSMSPVRFGKAFKACTGKKLGDYINALRVQDAKKMLEEKQKSISDIAFDVGFESLRSFNRVFIQHTGMTPSEYRNRTKII